MHKSNKKKTPIVKDLNCFAAMTIMGTEDYCYADCKAASSIKQR